MSERPVDPDLVDVLDAREEDLLLRLNTGIPARVQSYDAALQVVDAVPLVRASVPRADGDHDVEDLPVVPSVPVVWPRVGAWALTGALTAGDTGLLVCLEADLGTWRAGDGSVVSPVDLRRHHLSHAVFIPGLYVRSRALAGAASGTAAMVLGHDTSGARITFRADGSVEVSAATGMPLTLQGGVQPYILGTIFATALGTFLTALGAWIAAVAAAIAGLAVYVAAVAVVLPVTAPAAGVVAPLLAAVAGATTAMATAVANFASASSSYLSTRIRGA